MSLWRLYTKVRAGRPAENLCLLDVTQPCTHELVITCTRVGPSTFHLRRQSPYDVPPIPNALLAVEVLGEKGISFFSSVAKDMLPILQ